MRRLFAVAVLLGGMARAASPESSIRAVLDTQVADWNHGDVRAFMRGYDDSADTLFIGSSVARGYQRVLDRYLARYGTKEKMGRLTFSNLEVHPLGDDYALVVGNFHLARSAAGGGDASGIFTLTFARRKAGWKIIADHTSDAPPAQ